MQKREFEYIEGEVIGEMVFLWEDFHELEVTGFQQYRKGVFLCKCGRKIITRISAVKYGKVKSCGCERKVKHLLRINRHGMCETPEYKTWEGMKQRCYNQTIKQYKNYGGRGIVVCEEWKESFKKFFEDMGIRPSDEHSIDRIDVNGNYCKENCRWVLRDIQDRNRTNNYIIEYKGKAKIIADISRETGIYANTLKDRMSKGMTIEEAILKPTRRKK